MNLFRLEIITPYQEYPAQQIEFLDVPAHEGRLTVLAGHEPCLCLILTGIVRVRGSEGETPIHVTGPGTLRVTPAGAVLVVLEAELRQTGAPPA